MSDSPTIDPNALQGYFQQYFGRGATPDELKYLTEYLGRNQMTNYEAGQQIAGSPEAQQRQFQNNYQQYQNALGASDSAIMDKAGNQLQGQFAQNGRPDTSGYTSAYLSAAKDLAISRQPAIAQFYGQGLNNLQQQNYNQGQNVMQRGYNLQDQYRQRAWNNEDYNRGQNDYNGYLNQQNRQARTGFLGQLGGAAVGGSLGGPWGALFGSKIGSGLGMWG